MTRILPPATLAASRSSAGGHGQCRVYSSRIPLPTIPRPSHRKDTYDATIGIVREHSGAYGMGVDYAYTLVHKEPERVKHGPRIGPNPAK